MAIYTSSGVLVTLTSANANGSVNATCLEGLQGTLDVSDLRADGGVEELSSALAQLSVEPIPAGEAFELEVAGVDL